MFTNEKLRLTAVELLEPSIQIQICQTPGCLLKAAWKFTLLPERLERIGACFKNKHQDSDLLFLTACPRHPETTKELGAREGISRQEWVLLKRKMFSKH